MATSSPEPRQPGKFERLALLRQVSDLSLARRPEGHPKGFTWDEEAAKRAVHFIEGYCRHSKGEWAGQPLLLEDWQKRHVIAPIFGWKRADGTRRYRAAYIEIPRKNGKTQLAAGVGLYLLVADNEPGADVFTTATKREQALLCHNAAAAMVKASPELMRFVKVGRWNLSVEKTGSKMEPLSADHNTLDGLNPHGDLRDELHAWTDSRLAHVLDTALGARRQPLTFSITTAGTYDPESIGWQTHDYATKVLDGTFEDDQFFAYIAAADLEDDWREPGTWAKANPNMGVSLKGDYIARQCAKAEKQNSFTNEFLRLHLNRWTAQVTRWLSPEAWIANDATPIDEDSLIGRTCYGGLDLATKYDLTTLVLWFPNPDGTATILCRAWLPAETAKREADKGRRHYQQWAEQGWLTLTNASNEYVHADFVEKEILDLSQKFRIQELGFDPWNATTMATHLSENGLTMVEMRQGPKTMSEPSKDFEIFVNTKRLHHGGNPILRWAVANVCIRSDVNGNIAPDRKSSVDKIDPVVASIMALSRANGKAEDVYTADRGFRTL